MVAAYSGTEKYNENEIKVLIRNHHIGGLIFMQGTAKKQAELTNVYQGISKTPLLIAMDAEWGLGMRLTGIQDLPQQLFLGAANDTALMKKYGEAVAAQCKRLGVHINFAPVVDVNNNPRNPVINARAFGEQKELVSNLGNIYMRALQDNGIMACAKHFPGHGDTDVDSHEDLPTIKKSREELEKLEFQPFKELIKNGVQSIMVAHLNIPALEDQAHLPTTLSKKVVTDLLKRDLTFGGLVFTDALNMQGVSKYYKAGEADYLALKAGNDVLLFSEDVAQGIRRIKAAIDNNEIPLSQLEKSVKKILMAKFRAGLGQYNPISTIDIDEEINAVTAAIRSQTAQKGITLLSDPYNVLDKIKNKANHRIAYVVVGATQHSDLASALNRIRFGDIYFAATNTAQEINTLKKKLKQYDAVVIGVHDLNRYATRNYGLDFGEQKAIKEFGYNKNAITVLFGNPYAISYIDNDAGFLVCYDEQPETIEVAIQILNGELGTYGKLPISSNHHYKAGDGIVRSTNILGEPKIDASGKRVYTLDNNSELAKKYRERNNEVLLPSVSTPSVMVTCCVSPMAVGAKEEFINKVDDLIQQAIAQKVFPGCRIMALKDGKVFYDRSFGHLTYSNNVPVTANTIYDLASVTKIAATTIAVMKLYEQGKIDLDATLGTYLPKARGTNKEHVLIKNLLLHQAGLHAWIPFYKETIDENGYPNPTIYQTNPSALYSIKVANGLYMNRHWVDTMWKRIYDSDLTNLGRYKYSDLDFIFLQKVVERVAGMSLDQYVYRNFYQPLGMLDTKFNPRQIMNNKPIAPTELDDYFRHKKVQGYVHDMGAAMFGGVSGHAGLFSTAQDISILMQMLLNGGVYNGKRYLEASTVELFTAKNSFISRRALGFDKPEPQLDRSQPTATNCSLSTFGHTGFTGTCVWADPTHNIQFIFLSNRTFPSSRFNKLAKLNIREKAQQYIYQAFGIRSR